MHVTYVLLVLRTSFDRSWFLCRCPPCSGPFEDVVSAGEEDEDEEEEDGSDAVRSEVSTAPDGRDNRHHFLAPPRVLPKLPGLHKVYFMYVRTRKPWTNRENVLFSGRKCYDGKKTLFCQQGRQSTFSHHFR